MSKQIHKDFKCKFDSLGGLELKTGGLVIPKTRRKHTNNWFICQDMTKAMGLHPDECKPNATVTIRISSHDFPGALLAITTWGKAYIDASEINCLEIKAFKPGTTKKDNPVFIGTNKSDALLTNMTTAIRKMIGTRIIKHKDTITGYIGPITDKQRNNNQCNTHHPNGTSPSPSIPMMPTTSRRPPPSPNTP